MDDITCPACGGEPSMLGFMGSRAWFRCRNCGWDFSVDESEVERYEDEFDPEDELARQNAMDERCGIA